MTIRRLKTYTGSQGYVYQYYFVGQQRVSSPSGTEYIFDVTSDRKTTFPVSIILADDVIARWDHAHSRLLTSSEQYAAVKLRLFRAFDKFADIQTQGHLQIDSLELEQALASLGID